MQIIGVIFPYRIFEKCCNYGENRTFYNAKKNLLRKMNVFN